jgi:hypothetical protein
MSPPACELLVEGFHLFSDHRCGNTGTRDFGGDPAKKTESGAFWRKVSVPHPKERAEQWQVSLKWGENGLPKFHPLPLCV